MTSRRKFTVSGPMLVDVYGQDSSGRPVSVHLPVTVIDGARSTGLGSPQPQSEAPPSPRALGDRRLVLLQRLREAAIADLSAEDFIECQRLRDPAAARLLEARFDELTAAWCRDEPDVLAAAASAVLLLNPCHRAAASLLTQLLFSSEASAFVRTMTAGHLNDAFQPTVESEAMSHLREAFTQLIHGTSSIPWGPFAYTCVGHMVRLEKEATLALCQAELKNRDVHDRRSLILAMAETPDADVIRFVLHCAKTERSPRVLLSILKVVRSLMSEKRRKQILAAALGDESPSLRWSAIKALHEVRSSVAEVLASEAIGDEPDEILRRVLNDAIERARAETARRKLLLRAERRRGRHRKRREI